MLRPSAIALLALLSCAASADTPTTLWIARPEAQPWLPAIARAAAKTDLPAPLIAELIGMESGFRNVKNPTSSARGFGQQINGIDDPVDLGPLVVKLARLRFSDVVESGDVVADPAQVLA